MSRRHALLFVSLGLAAVVGCYTGPESDLTPAVRGPATSSDGTEPANGSEHLGDGGTAIVTGIPCDVAKILTTSCTDCHGAKPTGGAPNSLLTYDDLIAPSESDPKKSVAAVSVERMSASKRPMPPDGALPAADVAILAKWVAEGMPKGTCGTPAKDGGASTDGGGTTKEAGTPPVSVCTSKTTFPADAGASEEMHPGKKCIGCHSATGGPAYSFAGTVFPTLHEPDDCNGATSAGLKVVIVDAAGKSHNLPVNDVGNFFRISTMPLPYTAMIVDGIKTRTMKTPQTDGDCNGCHSELGNKSPGRIMAP